MYEKKENENLKKRKQIFESKFLLIEINQN